MKTETIKIPSKDNKNIAAAIHCPDIDTDRLVILCPGNVDSKDYDHLVKLAKAFASQGYTAVRFDPIGTWEFAGYCLYVYGRLSAHFFVANMNLNSDGPNVNVNRLSNDNMWNAENRHRSPGMLQEFFRRYTTFWMSI
jgi:hypothetical protein